MSLSPGVAESNTGFDSRWLASLEVRAARVEERFDSLVRSEKLDSTKQAQRRDLALTTQSPEFLFKPHRNSIRWNIADINQRDVKQPLLEAKIDYNVRAILPIDGFGIA